MSLSPPLRPYQATVLDRSRQALADGASSVLIVQPCGTGKTRLAVEACFGHVERGGIALFTAPRIELVTQATAACVARGLEPERNVFVRTIQELMSPGATIPSATMVVEDEARHNLAPCWNQLRDALPNAVRMGLDATPSRGNGLGLGALYDVLLEAITVKDAIAEGYLVPYETIRPAYALQARELAQDPLTAWLASAGGESTIIFVYSVEAAHELACRFLAVGVPAAAIWGDMPADLRDLKLAQYAAGDIRVLVNVRILTEGWDSPRTSVVMLASNVATVGEYLQRVGRGMRPFHGKTRMLLIDLTGCSHTHGDPDEDRTWHLAGRAARRALESAEVRFCPACGAPVTSAECETCHYSGAMKQRKPRVLGLPMQRFARQRAASDEEKTASLASYMRRARAMGRQQWWAISCWKGVHGVLPSAAMRREATKLSRQKR